MSAHLLPLLRACEDKERERVRENEWLRGVEGGGGVSMAPGSP